MEFYTKNANLGAGIARAFGAQAACLFGVERFLTSRAPFPRTCCALYLDLGPRASLRFDPVRGSSQKRRDRAQSARAHPLNRLRCWVRTCARMRLLFPPARGVAWARRGSSLSLCVFVVAVDGVFFFLSTRLRRDREERAGRYHEHEPHHRPGAPRRTRPCPHDARAARNGPPLKREQQRCPAEREGSWRRRTLSWRTSSGARAVRLVFNFLIFFFARLF